MTTLGFHVPAFLTHLSRKNEYRILSAMLLLLHLAVWWDFGSSKSRSLLLAHAGVFLIWQPFWRLEKRFGLKDTVLFSLVSIGLAYWLDRWIFFCWFVVLIGLLSGFPGYRRSGRLVYVPILFFLVSDLLIGCVPHLFHVKALPPAVTTMFQYGLLAVPAWVFIVRPDPGGGASSYSVDLLRAITASMMTGMLAVRASRLPTIWGSIILSPCSNPCSGWRFFFLSLAGSSLLGWDSSVWPNCGSAP